MAVLEEARRLGFLGPGPVAGHLDHAAGFAVAIGDARPARAADLGNGGGVPSLPLALALTGTRWTLIESSVRRASFLREAVASLDLGARVEVLEARAEVAGRSGGLRRGFDLAVARGFGRPAVAAECAAPLLRVGGRAVVSEPPGGAPDRWPPEGLSLVGMAPERTVVTATGTFQVLVQVEQCPDRFPRRVGMPAKRPLF